MKYIRDRKKRFLLAVLLGMLLTLLASGAWKVPGRGVAGFFGMLYPQYCFSEVPKPQDGEAPLEPKFTFRWLKGI